MTDPKIISLPDLKEIEREAAHWFVRFDSDTVADKDVAEFQKWYHISSVHKDALERMSEFWGGLSVLKELKDHAAANDVVGEVFRDKNSSRNRVRRRVFMGGIAASIAIVVGFGTMQLSKVGEPAYTNAYQTEIGEQKTINLPDGSQIIINTNSAFDVVFSKDARAITLTRGEAFFDVAPDPDKPFSVITRKGVVTAVGTAFSVHLRDGDIDVLVTEGRVSLTATQNAPSQQITPETIPKPVEVSAGQSVLFAQRTIELDVIAPAVLEKKIDWRDGFLAFKGETLETVIADIGRYTNMRIDIDGEDLRQQKVVAYYRVGEIEPMFEALNLMANVEVERVSTNHVRLYRAN